jgi:DDE family transposase
MTHAPVSSVPSLAAQPNRALRRWLARELGDLAPVITASARACAAERYRKHFHSLAHATILLFHGLAGSASLRQSYAAFGGCTGLLALSGVGQHPDGRLGVSYSTLASANSSRPTGFLAGLAPVLARRVRALEQAAPGALPPDLVVLDATFLRLSLCLAPWSAATPHAKKPGVTVQVQYRPAWDLPEHILLTPSTTPDVKGLDQAILDDPVRLATLRGHTLVVDLGYYSHARFARLRRAGVHFVTRLHPQAALRVEAEQPVQPPLPATAPGRITILRDQRVAVGSVTNRAGAHLRGLRLVSAAVAPSPKAARRQAAPVVYRLLTDRRDLSAMEVVHLYLWRWQIELFFRWLKSHLHLPHLLGYSRSAVELSVWLALIVHLLCVLAAHALGRRRRSPTLLRQLPFLLGGTPN